MKEKSAVKQKVLYSRTCVKRQFLTLQKQFRGEQIFIFDKNLVFALFWFSFFLYFSTFGTGNISVFSKFDLQRRLEVLN